jgi:CIC family chloride channel protein
MRSIYKFTYTILTGIQNTLTSKQFILFSSVLVGLASALAVIILKYFASLIFTTATAINNSNNFKYLLIVLPVIGIVMTVLFTHKVLRDHFDKGTSKILYAIVKRSSNVPRKQMYTQIITSAMTVGMGGSAGLESPIVITGAALGSNYSRFSKLDYKTKTLLLACGVAAGISAAFNAPIAGVLFVTEVLLVDISISAFIPLLIAAATGALVSTIVLDENILLSFKQQEHFHYQNVPFYIMLGILCGFATVYYARISFHIENFFEHHKVNRYIKALGGSCVLVILIYLFPSLFGEGYESIKTLSLPDPERLLDHTLFEDLRNKQLALLVFVSSAMLLKVFATGITLGSGGNGGSFAPSLFMGAYLGFLFSRLINLFHFTHHVPVSNFTIVGMAGVLSGIFHAPLTAIFLIGEITGGYELMVPLMIVSSLSFAISKSMEQHSMEVKLLAKMGHIFTGDKDKDILSNLNIHTLIEKDFDTLHANDTLGELAHLISVSDKTVFPVISDHRELTGLLYLDQIRKVIFDKEQYQTMSVKELMTPVTQVIAPTDKMDQIMHKFDRAKAWYLPVVEHGKYIGFISKLSLLDTYRTQLITSTID